MKPVFLSVLMAAMAALGFGAVVTLGDNQILKTATASGSLPAQLEQPVLKATDQNSNNNEPLAEPLAELAIAALPGVQNSKATSAQGAIAALPKDLNPFASNIGGSFDLIDHFGDARQLEDYRGKHVMIFFGYANCLAICSAALPLMADTIDLLEKDGENDLVPLMITVDPKNDTPDFMRKKLAEYHTKLIGMTGSEAALSDVRKKFQIRVEYVGQDIDDNPIYNHGSFIYLLGPDGKFQTLVPPILGPDKMSEIVKKYLNQTTES